MVRKVSISQLNNMLRREQQKQKQAINKYNQEVRSYNQKRKRAIDEYNREAKKHNQAAQREQNKINNEIRSYNARIRSNQQRLRSELQRLKNQTSSTHYVDFRSTVDAVQTAYERLDQTSEAGGIDSRYNEILDLSEREAANSAGLMNALLGDSKANEEESPNSPRSELTPILETISPDLADRWKGAVFALSPQNPDAARHFCTSAREIVSRILDEKAPDSKVTSAIPDCEITQQGTPTRRAKIRYFLQLSGLGHDDLEEFVENDMNNVVELFHVFNKGTHGSAGTFNLATLQAIRMRVEDGIIFLSRLIPNN